MLFAQERKCCFRAFQFKVTLRVKIHFTVDLLLLLGFSTPGYSSSSKVALIRSKMIAKIMLATAGALYICN